MSQPSSCFVSTARICVSTLMRSGRVSLARRETAPEMDDRYVLAYMCDVDYLIF
jgi:hypothetical protein